MSVKEMYMGREMTGATTLAESIYNEMGGDTPLITESQTVKGAVNELKTIEGTEAYDNTATYAVGDYCIYNSTRYKCITAVTTAEDFDSTKWSATTTNNDISELNTSLLDKCSIQYSDSVNLTLTSGTSMQVLHHATLPAGKWLVHTMVRFASNGTGRRGLTVYRDSTHETSVGVLTNDFRSAVDGAPTCLKATYISEITTGNNELYVCGYQNSGSSLAYTVRVIGIKLG